MAEFTVLLNEVESFGPVTKAIRSSREPGFVSAFYRNFDVVAFAAKMDALLTLLNVTTDALTATWDIREGATAADTEIGGGDDFGPTIQ